MKPEDEITRTEIAKILKVSPQRVSQYTFMPKPTRYEGCRHFYNKADVLAAIARQYPAPKETTASTCAKYAKESMLLGFITGRFDPEEKQEEYAALKFWAKEHKPKTKRVRIKSEFSMRGGDKCGPKGPTGPKKTSRRLTACTST